jgi:Zinc carboxypeptidase
VNHHRLISKFTSRVCFGRIEKESQSAGLYAASACSDDYAYSIHIKHKNDSKVYSFTVEFGNNKTGFIPPITEMKNIIKEISSAMTELCLLAYSKIPGARHLTSSLRQLSNIPFRPSYVLAK